MPDFLVFQLYGAMAAWGDIAVGEHRPSLGHPGKSAIIGLLAAALGIERSDDAKHQQLTESYQIAVCVQASGELLRDYHTIQVPGGKRTYATRRDELLTDKLNLNTILSQRDYRTDAVYQVAVWSKNKNLPFSLESLQQHLQQPVFTLYLGRKSCPVSLPLQPKILKGFTLQQAFEQYPLNQTQSKNVSLLARLLPANRWVSYYWEASLSTQELGLTTTMTYPRRDQVTSRKRWQFTNREEFYCTEQRKGAESCI
jgi:CRISPR system Cascade subunit CasD